MNFDFQDMDPQAFVLLAVALGSTWAAELPFNQQNAVSNWVELVAQVMETYNAQQQYLEVGPGNEYNPLNKNIYNPNCEEQEGEERRSFLREATIDGWLDRVEDNSQSLKALQQEIDTLNSRIDLLEQRLRELGGS